MSNLNNNLNLNQSDNELSSPSLIGLSVRNFTDTPVGQSSTTTPPDSADNSKIAAVKSKQGSSSSSNNNKNSHPNNSSIDELMQEGALLNNDDDEYNDILFDKDGNLKKYDSENDKNFKNTLEPTLSARLTKSSDNVALADKNKDIDNSATANSILDPKSQTAQPQKTSLGEINENKEEEKENNEKKDATKVSESTATATATAPQAAAAESSLSLVSNNKDEKESGFPSLEDMINSTLTDIDKVLSEESVYGYKPEFKKDADKKDSNEDRHKSPLAATSHSNQDESDSTQNKHFEASSKAKKILSSVNSYTSTHGNEHLNDPHPPEHILEYDSEFTAPAAAREGSHLSLTNSYKTSGNKRDTIGTTASSVNFSMPHLAGGDSYQNTMSSLHSRDHSNGSSHTEVNKNYLQTLSKTMSYQSNKSLNNDSESHPSLSQVSSYKQHDDEILDKEALEHEGALVNDPYQHDPEMEETINKVLEKVESLQVGNDDSKDKSKDASSKEVSSKDTDKSNNPHDNIENIIDSVNTEVENEKERVDAKETDPELTKDPKTLTTAPEVTDKVAHGEELSKAKAEVSKELETVEDAQTLEKVDAKDSEGRVTESKKPKDEVVAKVPVNEEKAKPVDVEAKEEKETEIAEIAEIPEKKDKSGEDKEVDGKDATVTDNEPIGEKADKEDKKEEEKEGVAKVGDGLGQTEEDVKQLAEKVDATNTATSKADDETAAANDTTTTEAKTKLDNKEAETAENGKPVDDVAADSDATTAKLEPTAEKSVEAPTTPKKQTIPPLRTNLQQPENSEPPKSPLEKVADNILSGLIEPVSVEKPQLDSEEEKETIADKEEKDEDQAEKPLQFNKHEEKAKPSGEKKAEKDNGTEPTAKDSSKTKDKDDIDALLEGKELNLDEIKELEKMLDEDILTSTNSFKHVPSSSSHSQGGAKKVLEQTPSATLLPKPESKKDEQNFNDEIQQQIINDLKDQPVYIYTSLAGGGFHMIPRTNRLTTILTANKVPFTYRDLGTDEEARKVWKRYSSGRTLPAVVRGKDDIIGNWQEMDEYAEYYEVRKRIYEMY